MGATQDPLPRRAGSPGNSADRSWHAQTAAKEVEGLPMAKHSIDVLINNAGVNVGGPKSVLDE